MYLREPEPTPYDVRFRLFSVPVRIHPYFWILHGFVGAVVAYLTGWIFCFVYVGSILVSLLIHEMGHALAGRVFGTESVIVLTPFYGMAIGAADLYDRWKRVVVLLAGSVAQLLFAALLWLALRLISEWLPLERGWPTGVVGVLIFLTAMNLMLPLLNLLPVPPLDGWGLAREAFLAWSSQGAPPWEQDPDAWKRR